MNEIDGCVLDLATRRDGVLSRPEIVRAGASRRQIQRMAACGLLQRMTPGVFLVRGHRLTWTRRLRIAQLQAGEAAVISHAAAAVLLQWPRIGPGAVEVTIPWDRAVPRVTVGRVHQTRRVIRPDDVLLVGGLPVTGPARTLLDLAPRLGAGHLGECVVEVCHRGMTTVEELRSALDDLRGRGVAGGPRLAIVLQGLEAVPRADSFLEAKFLALVRDHGLPAPRTQVVIEVDGFRYRVDALWDDWRFIVELNGYGTHASRHQLAADSERAARLQSAGFELVVFTYDQVMDDPRFVLAQVGLRLQRPRVA